MTSGRTLHTPENLCPHCGHRFNACTSLLSLDSPNEGDLSVCIKCGGLLELNADLTVRALSPDKAFQLILKDPAAYDNLMKTRKAVLSVKKGGTSAESV